MVDDSLEVDKSLEQIKVDTDNYFITTIINAKKRFIKNYYRNIYHKISFVSLSDIEEKETTDTAPQIFDCFTVGGIVLQITDFQLSNAISELSPVKRDVLFKSVIFGIPEKEIANNWGISVRMVKKHKHTAIEIIKRKLKESEE